MASQVLSKINGPKFREQRLLLMRMEAAIAAGLRWKPDRGDADLLDGLVNLTDAIADEAHDRYGIDCLLTEDDEPLVE